MDYRFFDIAAKTAELKLDNRQFRIGAVGIRSDGSVVKSSNGPVMMDREEIKGSFPPAHAEARLAKKLDVGAIVFVVRVRKDNGQFAMAKPCKDCQRVLISRGVKRIYYTINNTSYGILDENGDIIKIKSTNFALDLYAA